MKLQRGVNATRVLQGAEHKLFVEGKDNQEIDPVVIQELLNNNELTAIEVQTMGGCDNVRSAAQALIYQHPSYYFLIDRDDQNQTTVDESWLRFPDPNAYNMLIWRKRELENYFIDPDYLEKSEFLKPNPRIHVRQRILTECQQRLFLDAANLVLHFLNRELQKPLTVKHFKTKENFADKDAGIQQLELCFQTIETRKEAVVNTVQKNTVKDIYSNFIEELSGGVLPLQYDSGTWLTRMSGKEVFHVIANDCFQVKNASGVILTGTQQNNQIAKALVRLPLEQQPQDFQELIRLLKNRIK